MTFTFKEIILPFLIGLRLPLKFNKENFQNILRVIICDHIHYFVSVRLLTWLYVFLLPHCAWEWEEKKRNIKYNFCEEEKVNFGTFTFSHIHTLHSMSSSFLESRRRWRSNIHFGGYLKNIITHTLWRHYSRCRVCMQAHFKLVTYFCKSILCRVSIYFWYSLDVQWTLLFLCW